MSRPRRGGARGSVAPDDAARDRRLARAGEEPALEAALRAGVPYVALVASRVRGAAVLASLDVAEEQRARVHSPAGLVLGGHTAAEIALSVLAELVQERALVGSAAASGAAEPAGPGSSAGSADPTASGAAAPAAVTLGQAAPVQLAIDPVCGMSVAAIPASRTLTPMPARSGSARRDAARRSWRIRSGMPSHPEVRAGACGRALDEAGHP